MGTTPGFYGGQLHKPENRMSDGSPHSIHCLLHREPEQIVFDYTKAQKIYLLYALLEKKRKIILLSRKMNQYSQDDFETHKN